MRNKFLTILTTAVLLLAITVIPAFAGSVQTEANKTVRMGFFEFGGMFEGAAIGAEKSGYCYEYMMQVSTYTGWRYDFIYGTYAELYDMLKKGQIDILPYTNYNEQRGREVLFSDKALVEEEYYIAVQPERSGMQNPLDGATISTLYGADYNDLLTEYIETNHLDLQVKYYNDLEDTWNALRDGSVDATVFTSNAYSEDGWTCIATFGKKPTYIAVAQGHEDLLAKLNEVTVLIDRENPAFVGELYAHYFSDNPMWKSLTAEEQAWIAEHPVLRVGGFTNDAPYFFTVDSENGTATGLTIDVVNGIIDRLHLNTKAQFRAYDTLMEMEIALQNGDIDVIIPFYPSYSIAQEQNLVISNTVRVSNMELVYKSGTSYSDALKKVATPATKLGIYYVHDTFPDSEIVRATSIQDAVNKVLNGEATGAIAQNVVMHSVAKNYDELNYVVLSEGCGTCFATSPENYTLIRILNRGLNYFSNAEISAIASQYTLEPTVTTLAYLSTHKEAVVMLVIIFITLIVLTISLIQMSRLKKEANKASNSKTEFLFNMSHDIRTPMNAITGFTRMAKKNKDNTEKLDEYLDKIDTSGQQLLTLVNQVLEMARIETGKIELEEVPVNIPKEYNTAVTVLSDQAEAYGLSFSHSLTDIVHENVLADIARMSSITLNITGNAMKYTPKGGKIDFELKEIAPRKEGCATFVFTVEDNGIGMSEEFQKVMFEPFTREKTSTVSRIQGAGLGMSIVKNLVDILGGEIRVDSVVGKGTRFDITVDFPIYELPNESKDGTDSEGILYSFAGSKVLLVEDNVLNREITVDILQEEGFVIETAEDGSAAVEMLREKGPDYYDYVLMDIQMPVMDGYEATRRIRKMYPDTAIPIIALSANAFAEDKAKSLEAGMDDHVAKPIVIEELFAVLFKFRK